MKPRRNIKRNEVAAFWPYNTRRAMNEAKRLASQAIGNGVLMGTVVKQPCEVCGDPDAEAHHPNYNFPLLVNWLCRPHHRERDRQRPSVEAGPHRVDVRKRVLGPRPKVGRAAVVKVTTRVRNEMDRQGLTQREFARLCGVSQPKVSHWFSAGFKTVPTLKRAAKALGLKLSSLRA